MTVVVIQYENRISPILNTMMDATKEYCERHGYIYKRMNHAIEMPEYWIKVLLVKEAMQMKCEELYVAWMDSDASFARLETRIETIVEQSGKDFVTSIDPGHDKQGHMNAGVFFIKRTRQTIQLVNEWLTCYDPMRWRKLVTGRWKTPGPWAGPDYEQGAFNQAILPKYRSIVSLQPSAVFASWDVEHGSDTLVCHFMANTKKNIPLFLEKLREKYPANQATT